jgi:hypothetical protein
MNLQNVHNPELRSNHVSAKRRRINACSEGAITIKPVTKKQNDEEIFHKIPIEVIRIFVKSEYLNIYELGRFMLFVSKSMVDMIFDTQDDLWQTLCKIQFGEEVIMLSKSIPNFNTRNLFLSLSRGEVHRPQEPPRPLKYLPSDYHLIINIYSLKDERNCFSKIINGSEVPEFFDDGSFHLEVTNLNLNFKIYENYPIRNFKLTLHLRRISDQKCCCLFKSDEFCQDVCDEGTFMSDSLFLFSDMNDAAYCRSLMRDIDESVDGFSFMVFLEKDTQCTFDDCKTCNNPLGNAVQHKYTYLKLETELSSRDYNFLETFPDGNNVKFAHFIEQLYGWDV